MNPPVPEDLLELWSDYQFIKSCDSIIGHFSDGDGSTNAPAEHMMRHWFEFLVQSPQLLRFLQVRWLAGEVQGWPITFNNLRVLLGVSWDDMRPIICPLRSSLESADDREENLRALSWVASCRFHMSSNWTTRCRDLARGLIRLLKEPDSLRIWYVDHFLRKSRYDVPITHKGSAT